MAYSGLGIIAAPILGPTLGGWITDSYSWRWVFYINVPVGILSLSLIYRFVYDPPYIRRGALRVLVSGDHSFDPSHASEGRHAPGRLIALRLNSRQAEVLCALSRALARRYVR
jgi:MFS family permease